MEIYSPAEVAKQLDIKAATLRKYSIMLEDAGYTINRNSQNHRYYTDKDVMTIRRVITGKDSDITLNELIKGIVSVHEHNTYTNDTDNDIIAYSNATNGVTSEDIEELKEMILLQSKQIGIQSEMIERLSNKLDQQQDYIEQQKQVLLETRESKKEGFFSRLFKRKNE